MFDVNGRRAIVTGGARGFGREFARRLLQKGCKVCISDVDIKTGEETKSELQREFGLSDNGLCFVECNVAEKEDWTKLWDSAEKLLEGTIDILANNAGVHPMHGWEKCLDIMMVGATRGVFTAIERMGRSKGGRGGRIINTCSVAGLITGGLGPMEGVGYTLAKHGMVTLTRSFNDVEPKVYDVEGIKCYGLAPFFADTKLVRDGLEVTAGNWEFRGNTIKSMADITQISKMRILKVEEVADAFMRSLDIDKDGAVYAIIPDAPLIEFPRQGNPVAFLVLALSFVAGRLGIDHFTPTQFVILATLLFLMLYYFFTILICWIF